MSFLLSKKFKSRCLYNYNKDYYIDENDDVDIVYKNKNIIYNKKSKYQNIQVYNNKKYGNILVIDNDIQLTENDESNYHEMLVHVPINYFSKKNLKVLVIGGGDGGTIRELSKHNNISELILIEIDIEVINVSKKYFKDLSSSFNDKRLKIIIDDGAKWIKNNLKKYNKYFDLILIDSTDYNTANSLFTDEFYINSNSLLNNIYSIFCFNCMSLSWDKSEYNELNNMHKFYKYVFLYQVFIPTYASGNYTFCFCSKNINPINVPIDFNYFKSKEINTKYYNEKIHFSSFNLPNMFEVNLRKDNELEILGTNYMIDVKNVKFDILNNYELIKKLLLLIIELYKLNIVSIGYKIFKPQGITITYILKESHLSIHTWPEKGKCCIDLFSCKKFKWNFLNDGKFININTIIKSFFNVNEDDILVNTLNREI